MSTPANAGAQTEFPIPVDLAWSTRAGLALFAVVTTLIVLWSIFAELHAGAIAAGEVAPFGKSKTVQHLEGGIIRELRVRDGEAVKAGQVLVVLDDGEARGAVAIAAVDQVARTALVERLSAERDGRTYKPAASASLPVAVASQLRLFEIRRSALKKDLDSLNRRAADLRIEQAAWKRKDESLTALIKYADEERELNKGLYEQNFIAKTRLLALESRSSETRASQSESQAEIARASQRITDTEQQIAKLSHDWMNTVLDDLRRAQDELEIASERVRVARERLARTTIAAPQDGIVKGLRTVTVGGVIPPGGVVLDVVPVSDHMVVEARVQPDDIDVVKVGTACKLRLTAYKARSHLRLDGSVIDVSASTFHDEKTNQTYYLARIEVSDKNMPGEIKMQMQPGMLAEVEIVGSARSPMRYLFDPIRNSLVRAFKDK